MQAMPTGVDGVWVLEPQLFGDARGFFYESFNRKAFEAATGYKADFVQDNHSKSARDVLRGLHFQLAPHEQGKLVRVSQGAVYDVTVDVRRHSPTYGQWHAEVLSADNRKQMWIPPGLAHGFLVLSDTAEFLYKTTGYYAPEYERCLRWDDPRVNITWPLDGRQPLVSAKDAQGLGLDQL